MGLLIDGVVYMVTEYQHVKPGKGSAFVRCKMRNVKTNQVLERTFRSSEKLDDVTLEERRMQNLYSSTDGQHFMDMTTYEEVVVPETAIEGARFLQDNLEVVGLFYNGAVVKVSVPNFIIAMVTQSDPGLKGDSSKSGGKPATIDTGATIQVPLFINAGEVIKVDTRTGTYVERAKK
ncbi:MAG: elongation factor P [Candidatus Omnitrophica bacterium]|nr:elongation factor P [Candidatus Omnitrophota bacterium]